MIGSGPIAFGLARLCSANRMRTGGACAAAVRTWLIDACSNGAVAIQRVAGGGPLPTGGR